jgi:hypothetical protein
MKVLSDTIKFRKEKFTGTVKLGERQLNVDMGKAAEAIASIVTQINALLGKSRDAINQNETQFNIMRETTGIATDYLPGGAGAGNAEKAYHGQFYVFSKPAQVDQLWFCQKNAADTYTWVQIAIP